MDATEVVSERQTSWFPSFVDRRVRADADSHVCTDDTEEEVKLTRRINRTKGRKEVRKGVTRGSGGRVPSTLSTSIGIPL